MNSNSIWHSILGLALLVGGGCGDADPNTADVSMTGDGDGDGDGDGEGDGDGDGDGDGAGDGDGDEGDGDSDEGDGDGDEGDGDGDEGDGDGDEGDGDGDEGDGDGDEGDGDGDGDEGDGDGDEGDGDGDEGDGDGGDGDGDNGSLTIEQACAAQCSQFGECVGMIPGCVDSCLQYHMGLNAQCLAAELELDECVLGLECPELLQMLSQQPKPYPCQVEQENSCQGGGGCTEDVDNGDDPGECSLTVDCPNDPERTVVCDGTSCTCYVDGDEVGGCDDPLLVCQDPSADSLAACCN